MKKLGLLKKMALLLVVHLPVAAFAEQDGSAQNAYIYHDGHLLTNCSQLAFDGSDDIAGAHAEAMLELKFCGIDNEVGDALYALNCDDFNADYPIGNAAAGLSTWMWLKLYYSGGVGGEFGHKLLRLSLRSHLIGGERMTMYAEDLYVPGNPAGLETPLTFGSRKSFKLASSYGVLFPDPQPEGEVLSCTFEVLIPERTRAVVEAGAVEKKAAVNLR